MHILRKNVECTSDGRSVTERPCTAAGRAGVGARGGIILPPASPGYYPRENFDILNAPMCILQRTQRRIGIVDEKQIMMI